MKESILANFESMAAYGTPPENRVIQFTAGSDELFARIDQIYLKERFSRGESDQKYVVGPFGSGKTHFINHLMELARERNCVTSKVTLNKEIDFTKSLVVYQEVVRNLTTNNETNGLQELLLQIKERKEKESMKEMAGSFDQWINGLDRYSFKLSEFGKLIKRAFLAIYGENEIELEPVLRWLSGEIGDKYLAKVLRLSSISGNEQNRYAQRMLHSLFQLMKYAGFQGTVVTFDEAEQGFQVERKKITKIHSLLMSQLNSLIELQNGAVFIVYAITPDIIEKIENFPALQQRLADPGPGTGFFDGNTYAPVINLSKRGDPIQDLRSIATKLTDLFLSHFSPQILISQTEIKRRVEGIVMETIESEYSSSNRRELVKRTCTYLLSLLPGRDGLLAAKASAEDEV